MSTKGVVQGYEEVGLYPAGHRPPVWHIVEEAAEIIRNFRPALISADTLCRRLPAAAVRAVRSPSQPNKEALIHAIFITYRHPGVHRPGHCPARIASSTPR